ncbi:MAG: hypothetical protein FWF01_04265 [Alphaproteobacteria bacterium]|nr:hypothetical protein [Alphaproteobacteria bacterium]
MAKIKEIPYEIPQYPVTTRYEVKLKDKNNGTRAVMLGVKKGVYWEEGGEEDGSETQTQCKSWCFKYAYKNGVLLPYVSEETLSDMLRGKPVKESYPFIRTEFSGYNDFLDFLLIPNETYTFIAGRGMVKIPAGQFVYTLPGMGEDVAYADRIGMRVNFGREFENGEYPDIFKPAFYDEALGKEKRGFTYRNQNRVLKMLKANKDELFCGAVAAGTVAARINECVMDYKGKIVSTR